jgi:uncharacterized membrane protein
MTDRLIFAVTLASALGSGLMAGVFFAFSVFVMRALARLQPAQGVAAMQAINVTVLHPLFLGVFVGTAGACVGLTVSALMHWPQPGAGYLLAGSLLYLAGTFGVTIRFNVPLNDALAAVEPAAGEAEGLWARYQVTWTAWNHVRTVAALLGAASLTLALACR